MIHEELDQLGPDIHYRPEEPRPTFEQLEQRIPPEYLQDAPYRYEVASRVNEITENPGNQLNT
jgi:hypothetical protein